MNRKGLATTCSVLMGKSGWETLLQVAKATPFLDRDVNSAISSIEWSLGRHRGRVHERAPVALLTSLNCTSHISIKPAVELQSAKSPAYAHRQKR